MIEKETQDIYYYVNEAYELVVNKYLESEKLDRDIDDMVDKLMISSWIYVSNISCMMIWLNSF